MGGDLERWLVALLGRGMAEMWGGRLAAKMVRKMAASREF